MVGSSQNIPRAVMKAHPHCDGSLLLLAQQRGRGVPAIGAAAVLHARLLTKTAVPLILHGRRAALDAVLLQQTGRAFIEARIHASEACVDNRGHYGNEGVVLMVRPERSPAARAGRRRVDRRAPGGNRRVGRRVGGRTGGRAWIRGGRGGRSLNVGPILGLLFHGAIYKHRELARLPKVAGRIYSPQ